MALLAYEDSLCSGCGQPKDTVYNPDADAWFEAREINCAGCAAQHLHGKNQKEPIPGQKTYVVDTRPPGLELKPWRLPSRADDQPADEQGDAE